MKEKRLANRQALITVTQMGSHNLSFERLCLLVSFIVLSVVSFGAEEPVISLPTPNLAAEQWVEAKIKNGEVADLRISFTNASDRVISAKLVERMLTCSPEMQTSRRQKVAIIGAVIPDTLNLENVTIPADTFLLSDIFLGGVNFVSATVLGGFSVEDSTLGGANFNSVRINRLANFKNACFMGAVDFTGAEFGGQLLADGVKFTSSTERVVFNNIHVRGTASFVGALFNGHVNFGSAEIGSQMRLMSSAFSNSTEAITFDGFRVTDGFYMSDVVFLGGARFLNMEVGGSLEADRVQFKNSTMPVDFSGLIVKGTASFDESFFAGPFLFVAANIRSILTFESANFTNANSRAEFAGLVVGSGALFNNAVFQGGVDADGAVVPVVLSFHGAKILGRTSTLRLMDVRQIDFRSVLAASEIDLSHTKVAEGLNLTDSRFVDTENRVNFSSAEIGNLTMERTFFAGSADFSQMTIHSDLVANSAQFTNRAQTLRFDGMKVGGSASFSNVYFGGNAFFTASEISRVGFFSDAVFDGAANFSVMQVGVQINCGNTHFRSHDQEVNFGGMKCGNLWASRTEFNGPVSFVGAQVDAQLVVSEAHFAGTNEITCSDLKVGQFASFKGSDFGGRLSFKDAVFSYLELSDISLPKTGKPLSMAGINFQTVTVGDSWKGLLKLFDRAEFSADIYVSLEKMFAQRGYSDRANKVYIQRRWRECWEKHNFFEKIVDLLLYTLVGFGRRPGLALMWSGAIIVFGTLVFNPGRMEPSKRECEGWKYSSFWYSVSVFLPLLDFHAHSVWVPKQSSRFAWQWARLQAIAGWVLIPLWVAAWTGIVK
jgi:uncharacterized protein YjbI with pentapeptide repeats